MPATALKSYLDEHRTPYTCIGHPIAYTAQKTAEAAHIKGRDMAKTVIVRLDGEWCMVVLPAHMKLDLARLCLETGARDAVLATEHDIAIRFPDCEIGAMPPFGNLYGMKVFVQWQLVDEHAIAFNAGTHDEVLRMAYADYERLVEPYVGNFAEGSMH